MPHGNRPRGARAKRKNKEHKRPAEEQVARLEAAINKRITRNPLLALSSSPTSADSAVHSPPAPSQEALSTIGIIPVSLDSDSDQALSPSEEGPSSAEDLNTQTGATSGCDLQPATEEQVYPNHTVEQITVPDGRLIIEIKPRLL